MAERKPGRLEEYRRLRRAPDDYEAPAGEEDAEQEDVEEDAEYDGGALGAASADTQPDVLLDVPALKVEEIHLEVEDLTACISLRTEVLNLLKLHVGAEVALGQVVVDLKGVDAVAQLKVRLDKVAAIIGRVLTTIDENPQILSDLTRGVGEAAEEVGQGAGEALEEVGEGTGRAAGEVGEGAGSAIEAAGGGLEEAAGDLGQGVGRAAGDVSEDAGDTVEEVRPGRGGAGSGREAGQTARRPERPPSPSRERLRQVRRQERPATAGSSRREPGARPHRRRRPE